jgi:hypothetical protein
MTNTQPASGNTADRIGIPDNRINWTKSPLVTQIRFAGSSLYSDAVEVRYYLTIINPADVDVRRTAMPTPDAPFIRLYSEGSEINPSSPTSNDGIMAIKAPPQDDEIKRNRFMVKGNGRWTGDVPGEFVIANSQLLTGTHIYEMVYWHSQLDWIDVREVLARTDAQGKGRMVYPITDNAPSNRLYFRVYKPTEEEAAKGRKIEFLGEVDARTQVPPFPRARPGDFSPRTGYWYAVGQTIDLIGGYHEVFVKEGDSMPNLPGKVGVDPFSFEWKYAGEHAKASRQ